jgi:hypothetical protein
MSKHSSHCRPALALAGLAAAVVPAAALAAPSQPKLDVRAAVLTRTAPTTWTGSALSPQLGRARLTVTGTVAFAPSADADPTPTTLRFVATFARGVIRGCIRNSVFLRPGGRQVWDGPGRVTSTSASLRRYRGLRIHDGASTPAADLTHAGPFRLDTDVPAREVRGAAPC